MKPVQLLASARDPAAAAHVGAVCRALAQDPRFTINIVAQPPATSILQAAGMTVRELPRLTSIDPGDENARALLLLADELLGVFRPDVLLCGLSSPSDGGIDEALLARRKVPAALLQDFWGERNSFFNAAPDLVFTLDSHAATMTRNRHGLQAVTVGSARHAEYENLNIPVVRQQMRDSLEKGQTNLGVSTIGLFGQPLWRFEGYRATLRSWIKAIRSLPAPVQVFYRPHPRETPDHIAAVSAWMKGNGVAYVSMEQSSLEECLIASDVACTVFSNCAYDAAYLNYFSSDPLVVPLLMLFDEEMRNYVSTNGNCMDLPYVANSIAVPVFYESELATVLSSALDGIHARRVWDAARNTLLHPGLTSKKVASWLLEISKVKQLHSGSEFSSNFNRLDYCESLGNGC